MCIRDRNIAPAEFNAILFWNSTTGKRRLQISVECDPQGRRMRLVAVRPAQGYGNCPWLDPFRLYAKVPIEALEMFTCLVHGTKYRLLPAILERGLVAGGTAFSQLAQPVSADHAEAMAKFGGDSSGSAAAVAGISTGSAGAGFSETRRDSYQATVQGFAKLGGRNDIHMAAFPPWSKQLRAGMHFSAETHVWVDPPALLALLREDQGIEWQPGYRQKPVLFASDSMAILSRITIPQEIFEAVTTCERGLYRVVWHKKYRDQKTIGHQGGQHRTDDDRDCAPEPSRYVMENSSARTAVSRRAASWSVPSAIASSSSRARRRC